MSFQSQNTTVTTYINKQHKATVNFPSQIDKTKIVFFEMYTEASKVELDDKETVYGLVQTSEGDNFPIHQIKCTINVLDQDQVHTLACMRISVTNLPYGKIEHSSQMFGKERFIALVFENQERSVYIYYLWSTGIEIYGQKNFSANFGNTMTGVEITNKKQLIVVFEYGKRIEVYHLDDLHYAFSSARPIFTIDSRIMQFFGVQYFAPIDLKVSIHHDEVAFVKTKTGIMAMNINEQGFPELLFQIPTPTSVYDF